MMTESVMTDTKATDPRAFMPSLPMYTEQIKEYLPHRYPFLLVDRVTDIQASVIEGYKNVSINEEFLQGHFPGYAIMPGVLIVEALAQISGILAFVTEGEKPRPGSIFLFAGAEKVRFKKPVVPGDQLVLKSELIMQRRGIYKFSCTASVDGIITASAEITISHQTTEV